jgi:hypothetical protein
MAARSSSEVVASARGLLGSSSSSFDMVIDLSCIMDYDFLLCFWIQDHSRGGFLLLLCSVELLKRLAQIGSFCSLLFHRGIRFLGAMREYVDTRGAGGGGGGGQYTFC